MYLPRLISRMFGLGKKGSNIVCKALCKISTTTKLAFDRDLVRYRPLCS